MVGLIIFGLCLVGSVALICFKGIKVSYDKSFTVDDKRIQAQVDIEELKRLEEKLNKADPKSSETKPSDGEESVGPMDSVIAEIHDLFGPAADSDNIKK